VHIAKESVTATLEESCGVPEKPAKPYEGACILQGSMPSPSNNVHETLIVCLEGAEHEPLLELVLGVGAEEKRRVVRVGGG
jgi:hypothetical protein